MSGVYSEFRSFALAAACADPLRIMTARVAAAPMIWSDGRSDHGVPARRPGSERFGLPAIQSAYSGALLTDVLSELGRFDEAIGHAEAAVRIAEAADHPFTLYFGSFYLGLAHLRRGDLPRATPILERCLDLCRTWQFVDRTPVVAAALGAASSSPAGLTRRSRWWRAPSRSSAVARITSGRRSFFCARG